MMKNVIFFTGTVAQPQRNRTFCQFNKTSTVLPSLAQLPLVENPADQ